jgi:ligand-binding sensor domain-containing protein
MKRISIISVRAVVCVCLAGALLFAAAVVWRAKRAIKTATEEVRAGNEFEFTARPVALIDNRGFESVSPPQVFIQAARFQDHLYLAGPAGLMEYDPSGVLIHRYSSGSELPGSPLVALAPALLSDSKEPELIIATADAGLLAFNGREFRQILPQDPNARAITAILASGSGHLLLGTKKRGVLVYNGKTITSLHSSLDNTYVTALAGSESDLWVGTLARGVLHFHAGETETFSEAQGLPDPQVLSLAVSGERTYVGTATGVAAFEGGKFSRVLAPGVLATALLASPTILYVGSEDQGVIPISLEGRRPNSSLEADGEPFEVHQLFASGDDIYAVARSGLYRRRPRAFGWERVLHSGNGLLTDRNISSLAADAKGQLWVGYFDRGLDLLTSDMGAARHVEDEHVFCVNRILPESRTGIIDVATANGLVRFNPSGAVQQVLTRADGLIADHVTDVEEYRNGLALATPAGLTFLDAAGARSMYAFQGLVNNHVYALGVSGDELLAGTLGGLSHLNHEDLTLNYTTATSGLKHNWITAVARVESEWMIGTYGEGVLGMDASGRFHPFEIGSGAFDVNPNAMLVRPAFVLAGTLGDGLYLYSRQSGRWSVIRAGLPSLNVTAFAAANGYIYVGTDNGLVRILEEKLNR